MNFAIHLESAPELTFLFGTSDKGLREVDLKIVSLTSSFQVRLTESDFVSLSDNQSILSKEDYIDVSFRALTCNEPDTQKLIEGDQLVWQYDALGIQEYINLGSVPLQPCEMTLQQFINQLLMSNAELNSSKQTYKDKIAALTQDRDLALSKYSDLVKEKEIADYIMMKRFKDLLNSKKRKIKNLMEEKNTQSQHNIFSQV